MARGKNLKEGQVYAVPLSNGTFTVAQLVNHHIIESSKHISENTFALFNIVYTSLEELKKELDNLDLSDPVSILTANSSPRTYKWKLAGEREITIKFDYKCQISSLGFFKNRSTDPTLFLEPYFGLFPWDGYAEDDWIEQKYLLPKAEIRKDIKYLRDYSLEELTRLMPENSLKLKQLQKSKT